MKRTAVLCALAVLALAGCGGSGSDTIYGAAQIRECMDGYGADLKTSAEPPGGGTSYAGAFGSSRLAVYIPADAEAVDEGVAYLSKDPDLEVVRMADDQILVAYLDEPSEAVRDEVEECVEPYNA